MRIKEFDYDYEPLYHATLRVFEKSIMTQGLKPGSEHRLFDWCNSGYVYLSNYSDVAESFIDPGVIEPSEAQEEKILKLMKYGGVVFTIDQNKLDRTKLQMDPHYIADEDEGAYTYIYAGVISPAAIINKKYFRIDI